MESNWGGTEGDKMTKNQSLKKKKKKTGITKIDVRGFFSKLSGILHGKLKQKHLETANVFHAANRKFLAIAQ